jgi:plastocyanin
MRVKVIVVVGVILLFSVVLYLINQGGQEINPNLDSEVTPVVIQENLPDSKAFQIEGSNFSFSLKEIRVNKGDIVRIDFSSSGGIHDWILDEFNARTKQITSGQSDSVEFTADKIGEFEYYCGVGNHRQMGMVGKLIVE